MGSTNPSTMAPKAKSKAKIKKAPAKAKKAKKGYKGTSSAYMFFAKDQREKLVKANPSATFGEIGKLLGENWKTCKDKSKYEKLAAKDKIRAAKDKAAAEK